MMPSPPIHDHGRHSLFLLVLCRQRANSHRSPRFPSSRPTNHLAQRRSLVHPHPTMRARKPIAATASVQPQQARTRGEIPIAPAALSTRHPPRFRALALFGRRPPECVDG